MKLYNYWIKFNNRKGEYERTDKDRSSWVTDRKKAEDALRKDLTWCNSNAGGLVVVADSGITEMEYAGPVVLEGELGDNDESYEDFEITIGGTELHDALYSKYRGNKVRLTMEILP